MLKSEGCRKVSGKSGVYTIDGQKVYCDMTTAGGGWLLLLTQKHVHSQYAGSVNPLTKDLSSSSPSISHAYSRNWAELLADPQPGSEFMIKRSNGDWVRFVQSGKWCGWSNTKNCNNGNKDTRHPFFTTGMTYDSKGKDICCMTACMSKIMSKCR